MARHFKLVGTHAINVLARLAAKNAVKLRGDGVRLTLVPPREIAEQAQRYLADHPELYQQAFERAKQMGLLDNRHKPDKALETPEWYANRSVAQSENSKSGTDNAG